nr:MAG: helix-turn-helix domain-containing protein [Candidatus Methanoperedens sp.]
MDNSRDQLGRFVKGHKQLLLKHTEETKLRISIANATPIDRRTLDRMYNKEDMSISDIAEELGVSRDTVSKYLHKHGIEVCVGREIEKRVEWSDVCTVSYILGVAFGDGSITHTSGNRSYVVSLTTKDGAFAESFEGSLKRVGLNPCVYRDRTYWKVVGHSRQLYKFVQSKKLHLEEVVEYCRSDESRVQFVKGFYESEGHDRGNGRGVKLNNTNRDVLEMVRMFLLESLDISAVYSTTTRNSAQNDRWKDVYTLYVPSRFKSLFMSRVKPVIKNRMFTEQSWPAMREQVDR